MTIVKTRTYNIGTSIDRLDDSVSDKIADNALSDIYLAKRKFITMQNVAQRKLKPRKIVVTVTTRIIS